MFTFTTITMTKDIFVWRLVERLLRNRQHYPDNFIEGETEKDTQVRNIDPQSPPSLPKQQINKENI